MQKILKTLGVVLVLGINHIQAQQDTMFFDTNWLETTRSEAAYFRPTPQPVENGYLITDYYITGEMQMQGISRDIEEEAYIDTVIWYYQSGSISQRRIYVDSDVNVEIYYYNKQGDMISHGTYLNNEPYNGTFIEEVGLSFVKYTVKEGVTTQASLFSQDTANKCRGEFYMKDGNYSKVDYFNNQGEPIGENNNLDENGGVIDGYEVSFGYSPLFILSIAQKQGYKYITPKKYYYTTGEVKAEELYNSDQAIQEIAGVIFYSKTGEKLDSAKILDGSIDSGRYYEYFEPIDDYTITDQPQYINTYKEGVLEGPFQEFYTSGKLKTEGTNVNGYPDGVTTTYSETGAILYQMTYQESEPWDGSIMEDDQLLTFQNGEIIKETEFFGNQKTKLIISHLPNNLTKTTYYSIDGKVIGTLSVNGETNYSVGPVEAVSATDDDGYIYQEDNSVVEAEVADAEVAMGDYDVSYNGVEAEYDNNDNIYCIRHYQNNLILQTESFYNNKLISNIYNEGTSIFYDLENNQKYKCTYKNGEPQTGTMLEFDETGEFITNKKAYLDGELNGESIQYAIYYDDNTNNYTNGHILTIKNFKNGRQHGESRFYDMNQNLLSTVMYINGEPQNGTVYDYDYDGQIFAQVPYENGALQGDVTYSQDGNIYKIMSYKDDYLTKTITYLSLLPDSVLTLTYHNEMPFNGKIYEYNELSEYQGGSLISITNYEYDYDTEKYRLASYQQYSGKDDNLSVKKSYYANGEIKMVQEMSDGSVHGTTLSYDLNGKLIAKGVYDNDFPQSGSFAAINYNNNSDYLILNIAAKKVVVTFYSDGKKESSIASETSSDTKSIYDVISEMLSMIDYNYDEYEFNEYL
jgi:antitoxin component YwqK of YwqJK toxin-antitoxin module